FPTEELRPPQFPQAPESLWPPPLREWLAPESVTSAVSSCHFSLPPPASESSRWRLWDAKLLPYVVLVNTKPQYIVHICILTPDTSPKCSSWNICGLHL